MSGSSGELLQGTLAILILKALLPGQATHGYGIARWLEATTDDVLRIEEGSLYPALRRVEDRGWVSSEWGLSENNRRARFYTITDAGRAPPSGSGGPTSTPTWRTSSSFTSRCAPASTRRAGCPAPTRCARPASASATPSACAASCATTTGAASAPATGGSS